MNPQGLGCGVGVGVGGWGLGGWGVGLGFVVGVWGNHAEDGNVAVDDLLEGLGLRV